MFALPRKADADQVTLNVGLVPEPEMDQACPARTTEPILARDGRRSIVAQMNPIEKQVIRSSMLGTLALVAVVFIPAGRSITGKAGHIFVPPFLLLHPIRSIS